MTGLKVSQSRAEFGGCEWKYSEPYSRERERLEAERNPADPDDPTPLEVDALELFDAMIEAAESVDGLGAADYDAPLGNQIQRANMPWLGELKARGVSRRSEGGSREYRIYFGEPDQEFCLLGALLAHKTAREMRERPKRGKSEPKSSKKQTKQIGAAMDIVQRWCRERDISYRLR